MESKPRLASVDGLLNHFLQTPVTQQYLGLDHLTTKVRRKVNFKIKGLKEIRQFSHSSVQTICHLMAMHLELLTRHRRLKSSKLLPEQVNAPYCREIAITVSNPGSVYSYAKNGVLITQSRIDGALQKAVPKSMRVCVLSVSHYPFLAGHPGDRQLYDSLGHEYYLPHMPNDAYTMEVDCQYCASQGIITCYQKQLYLFSAAGPLSILEMDILGP